MNKNTHKTLRNMAEIFLSRFRKRKSQDTVFLTPAFSKDDTVMRLNYDTLRALSRRSIPRRAINILKDGVLALPYQIVPVRADDDTDYTETIEAIQRIIRNPNRCDDYMTFFGRLLEDVLIGDSGAAEIVVTNDKKQPIELYSFDGLKIKHVKKWYADKSVPRFCQETAFGDKVYLKDSDVLYIQKNNSTDSPFGLSPLEAAFTELKYLFEVQKYAGGQASKALPKYALYMGENIDETVLKKFRKYMQEEIYGSGEAPVFGGTKSPASLQIGVSSDDGLYLEWQKLLITIIALTFNIDPKKLGQGSNTDRSTVLEQNESLLHEGIRPYALLLQDAINRKILRRLGVDDCLKFEYVIVETLEQKKLRQNLAVDKFNSGAITLNEYRKELGLSPLDSTYADMIQPEMKSALNRDYAINTGGFNGLGKNQKEDMEKKVGQTEV